MIDNSKPSRGIKVLRDEVARKIAAGEVIDRPFSVVRELLDNAIDSDASEISLSIEGGGSDLIIVTDNGKGMSRDDLSLCWLSHATSKIENEEDIYHISSMGFRGEALSSISTCSRMEILSRERGETSNGNKLVVDGGFLSSLNQCAAATGTTVKVSELFYNMPGRKRFLKRSSAESALCTNAYYEKVQSFPEITFRYFIGTEPRSLLPANSLKDRVTQVWQQTNAFGSNTPSIHHIEGSGDGFRFDLVLAGPETFRKDRKHIAIYMNKRRIQEYSLVQAIEYGFTGYLPGGFLPIASLFVEADPDRVDFNIHPAKREVRLRDLGEIHSRVSRILGDFLGTLARSRAPIRIPDTNREFSFPLNHNSLNHNPPESSQAFKPTKSSSAKFRIGKYPDTLERKSWQDAMDSFAHLQSERQKIIEKDRSTISHPSVKPSGSVFRGQIFNLFLMIEIDDKLILIDQHAAHERIIYNQLTTEASRSAQNLLLPEVFSTDPDMDSQIRGIQEKLKAMGIEIVNKGTGLWELNAVPSSCAHDSKLIIDFLTGEIPEVKRLEQELFASIACKKAVKDGEVLSSDRAESLAYTALSLPIPRCPHGRPVFTEISREELFLRVERT